MEFSYKPEIESLGIFKNKFQYEWWDHPERDEEMEELFKKLFDALENPSKPLNKIRECSRSNWV
jgi:hypothetical protein